MKGNNDLIRKSLFCHKIDDTNLSKKEINFKLNSNIDNNNIINKLSNKINSTKNIENFASKKEENNELKKEENKNDIWF